jgi:uncharacterized protein YpmB
MKFLKYVFLALLVIVVGLLFYQKVYLPKHTFKTTAIKKADMNVTVEGVGNVGSENVYKVSSVYGGRVDDFNVLIF